MKLIVAGSRSFQDYYLLLNHLAVIVDAWGVTEVVSGTASGADTLGEKAAKELNLPISRFPANWALHKLAAGPIRNQQMAKYADAALIFWDNSSKGTTHMIKEMQKLHKPILLIPFKNDENTSQTSSKKVKA